MTLFQVSVLQERMAVFYVDADTMEAAREDAEILTDGLDDNDFTIDQSDITVTPCPPALVMTGAKVWSGGENGDWR